MRVRFPASAAPQFSGNPFMRSSTIISTSMNSANDCCKTASASPKFARWRLASKTSLSSSLTSTRPNWRPPVRNIFRGFGAVFYKEVLHVRRDFATLFFSLIIPLLQMILLGFGIDTNIRQINTVVFNADGRRESRELLDLLKNSDTFHLFRSFQDNTALN